MSATGLIATIPPAIFSKVEKRQKLTEYESEQLENIKSGADHLIDFGGMGLKALADYAYLLEAHKHGGELNSLSCLLSLFSDLFVGAYNAGGLASDLLLMNQSE